MYTKDWLSKWTIYSPNKIAIEEYETGRSLTYKALQTNANKLARILGRNEIMKGDRVLVIAEHSLELVTLFGAAQKTGIIIVPINYRLTPSEIKHLVEDCKPSLILYDEHFSENISKVDNAKYPLKTIVELSMLINSEPTNEYVSQQIDDNDQLNLS